jgi:2-polyprenyl-6-methoxyphenol hydroxylase-like FAD-dependent oxidoreductase
LNAPVFIAGAGPSGLVLALWLRRLGVSVRIVDQAAEAGTTSRAVAVQARTLELYRQVGLADAVVAGGRQATAVNLWTRGARAARVAFGDLGGGLSPFPFTLIFPQDLHERLLIERLREAGVEVERGTTLRGFQATAEGVRVTLERAGGAIETAEAAYLAGCDGAHSTVRTTLGVGFAGGTYAHLFYVADVQGRGAVMNGELHVAFDPSEFLAIFPMPMPSAVGAAPRARFIGTIRADAERGGEALSWDDVSRRLIGGLGVEVERVNWFSIYRVHHRLAERFRSGRVFLVGDAAHIHSPVGGQGMNTGIGDAVNLAWKLAAVLKGRAEDGLLDSYESERIAFARRLVATTDRAFQLAVSPGPVARRVRMDLMPRLLLGLFALRAGRRLVFRTVSQIDVRYRGSPLSAGRAGAVCGGDRLPWIGPDDGRADRRATSDNFTPLGSLDWQVHVYGVARPELGRLCQQRGLALHVFPWRPLAMGRAGLRRDAVYLVRPDGYLAWVGAAGVDPRQLSRYFETRRLR